MTTARETPQEKRTVTCYVCRRVMDYNDDGWAFVEYNTVECDDCYRKHFVAEFPDAPKGPANE